MRIFKELKKLGKGYWIGLAVWIIGIGVTGFVQYHFNNIGTQILFVGIVLGGGLAWAMWGLSRD